jgi:hypothetical protein
MPESASTPTSFFKSDGAYFQWIRDNPGGFVLAASTRRLSKKGLILHRAACSLANQPMREGWEATGIEKACHSRQAALSFWARGQYGVAPTPCDRCGPA